MVSLHYTGANFTHRPRRGSRFARNNDRSTFPRVERGRKELVGRLCHSAFRVIFLDIDAREGQEREREKKGSRKVDPDKSINRPSFFPTRVIIIGLSVLPSTIDRRVSCPSSLSLSFCESAKGAVRVQKCWFCKEIYEIALN